jgi:hypothetical protein
MRSAKNAWRKETLTAIGHAVLETRSDAAHGHVDASLRRQLASMADLEPGACGLEQLRFAGRNRQFPRTPRALALRQQALGVRNGGGPDILLC